ncbi:hypothetical protein Q0F99_03325 [Rathayibacter oskolensis]|uniref:hypothetical protein n=1 Tax=Rathayibacter TaxID=33886 RepID=UPI0013177E83|nr:MULTISPECIES: hypothetical protein [Rathayibacter]QHC67605.1 hypothetical protein GSU68_14185 [Rathayibacter sp. VKM Ac-2759]WKK72097.1 hypothetical protein Q0F99_03325 [Rathayibacter oskolensis]
MSTSDNDIEPTLVDPAGTPASSDPSTAGLDEVGGAASGQSAAGDDQSAAGVDGNGDELNPPLPDWGPTDGVHGTDAETDDSGTATP